MWKQVLVAARIRLTRFDSIQAQKIADDGAFDLVQGVTFSTATRAQRTVPVDTGRLRASQNVNIGRRPGGVTGTVTYQAPYAAAVHQGARPRVIVPRRKRALAFRVRGVPVVVRRANWPGFAGQPWLFRTLVRVAGRRGFRVRPGVS